MNHRLASAMILGAGIVALSSCAAAPAPTPAPQAGSAMAAGFPDRAIRHDIPLTRAIRKAFAAGTRDSTGRPGPKYWQLDVGYRINARLDVPTATITGSETATVTNNSDDELRWVQLRLDQNIYAANVPRAEQVPEITDGMRVTRLSVNGQPVDLNPPPRQFRRGGPPPGRFAPSGGVPAQQPAQAFELLDQGLDRVARQRCVTLSKRTVEPGGNAVMATFAPDGPERCSGLPVQRFGPDELALECGPGWRLSRAKGHRHTTPRGVEQRFVYAAIERMGPV